MSPGGEQIRTELVRKGKTWKLDKKLCNLNLDELDPKFDSADFCPCSVSSVNVPVRKTNIVSRILNSYRSYPLKYVPFLKFC